MENCRKLGGEGRWKCFHSLAKLILPFFLGSLTEGCQINNDYVAGLSPSKLLRKLPFFSFTNWRKLYFLHDPQHSEAKILSSNIWNMERKIASERPRGYYSRKGRNTNYFITLPPLPSFFTAQSPLSFPFSFKIFLKETFQLGIDLINY